MTLPGFGREDVVRLLAEVEARLHAKGVVFDVQVVGGAALLLHGLLDRATEDIDARYASAAAVEQVVADMAAEHGLPAGWLNSNAAAYVPEGASWIAGPPGTSVAVMLADLPTLAAMKVAAERQKDIEDLGPIVSSLGIASPEDLVDMAYAKYGEDSIPLAAGRENYLIVAEEAILAAEYLRGNQ